MKILLNIFIIIFLSKIECVKILGIFPFPGYSQFILGEKLMGELAKRGHEVTVISEYEPKEKIENYETIKLTPHASYDENFDLFSWSKASSFKVQMVFLEMCPHYSEALFEQKIVQEFIKSDRSFDLVIVENFCNEAQFGFAEHFQAPLIVFTSQFLSEWNSQFVGNVYLPSISSGSLISHANHKNFFQRVENFLLHSLTSIYKELRYYAAQQSIMNKYFPNKMDIRKVTTSAEIMLTFSHPLTTEPSLLTSAVVEVGGFHITPKKLPNDIQKYLDVAKNGAILFSLGSNIKCTKMSKELFNLFLAVIRKLPHTVLWKCEREIIEKPKNLLTLKWMPQADILAHPNTIGFVTHSGLLSTTEAIHYGVPMIALPIFGDQLLNAVRAVENGIAEKLNILDMTANEFYETICKVTNNTEYKAKIKKMSQMFRDQPSKPLDRAVHAVEFVIKYKPGKLLRSPAIDLWWFQLYLLDVVLFILVLVIAACLFASFLIRKLIIKIKIKKQHRKKDQ